MNNQIISSQLDKLNNLFTRTNAFTSGDLELQSHWAKYLCILSAGFIENFLKEVFSAYAHGKSNPEILNFVQSVLKKIQNPKTKKLVEVANSFSSDWAKNIELFAADNGRKDAVDSIMSNRHLIAHGQTSTITLIRLKDYFKKALELMEKIEETCN